MLKKFLKKIIPKVALNTYRKIRREANYKKTCSIMNNLTLSQKFDYIYKNKFWGSDVNKKFYSGGGSHNPKIINPYIEVIKKFLTKLSSPVVVDLGCGDFNIGSQIFQLTKKYYGIDIVEDLINFNNINFKNENLVFSKLDITSDFLPKADVCLVRQVLQHLSNKNIYSFIKNINEKYKFLIVTEHLPRDNFKANYNIETNSDTRLLFNSGVILHKPPFNLKFKSFEILLKVNDDRDNSITETILYKL
jgi:hypothetical protein